MKIYAAMILVMVVGLFLSLGMLFHIPFKTRIITQHYNDTVVIFETKTEVVNNPVEVNYRGVTTVVQGIGVYEDATGGELIDIVMTLKEGGGGNYVEVTNHAFQEDLQNSLSLIRYYTERYTGDSLDSEDLFVNVNVSTSVVGGTSAAAYMTVGLIGLIENKTLNTSVVMTGSLSASGLVLPVSEVPLKMTVAAAAGKAKILVPMGNCAEVVANPPMPYACVSSISDAVKELLY